MVGKSLGHYEILEPLGSGGMGEVYRARDTNLRREVAIKVLPEELAADHQRLARLQREAQLLASVNHPNIAAIYSLEESAGTRWLVLELVEGETLERCLQRGPLPVADALRIAGQIADALEAAHDAGIVHRDLKSANVMLDARGRAKVLDFGIAKDLSGGSRAEASKADTSIATSADGVVGDLTATGAIVGTAPYMSPEQIRGKGVDKRSDNWAFGCLLFEMLVGRRPFDRETMADTLSAILEHDPDWSAVPADAPEVVHSLLRRCLQKDAGNRLRSIADARIELADLATVTDGASGGPGADSPWLSPRQQIGVTFAVLVTLVLIVGWGLLAALDRTSPPAPVDEADPFAAMAAFDPAPPNSVAVLPFAAVGGADEAFSEQLAAAVAGELAKISGLRVPTVGSSFRLGDREMSAPQMGRMLRVASILDGNVRPAGEATIVDVQLLDAASGVVRWTGSYSLASGLDDVFALQEGIARQVAEQLEVELVGREAELLGDRLTASREAYDAFLEGELAWPLRTRSSLEAALEHFGTAVRHDSDFALAHARLATTYLLLQNYGGMDGAVAQAGAGAAVDRALELAPDLGAAITAKADLMRRQGEAGWAEMYERAMELDVNDPIAPLAYWNQLIRREGSTPRVFALIRRSSALDPLNGAAWENVGWTEIGAGNLEAAVAAMRLAVFHAPDYPLAHMGLGAALHGSGHADQALEHLQRGLELSEADAARHQHNLGLAHASLGQLEPALELLESSIPTDRGRGLNVLLGNIYRDIAGSLDAAAGRYQNALDIGVHPRFILPMVIVELDRGDEGAAASLVATAEEMAPSGTMSSIARLNLDMYRSALDGDAPLVADLAERTFFTGNFPMAGDQTYLYGSQHPIEPLGYVGVLTGNPEDTLRFYASSFPELLGEDPSVHAFTLRAAVDLAAVLASAGEQDGADRLLARAETYLAGVPEAQRRHQFRTAPMEIYALQGRADDAFEAMELAFADGWRSGWWRLPLKPHFAAIRDDPRFAEMVERLRAAATG